MVGAGSRCGLMEVGVAVLCPYKCQLFPLQWPLPERPHQALLPRAVKGKCLPGLPAASVSPEIFIPCSMAGARTGSAGCWACLLISGLVCSCFACLVPGLDKSPFSRPFRQETCCHVSSWQFPSCSGSRRSGAYQWNNWPGKETLFLFPEGAHFSPDSSARCFLSASVRGAPLACPVPPLSLLGAPCSSWVFGLSHLPGPVSLAHRQ